VLAGLGVEGEHCSEADAAVERVRIQNFQIVIIDWDKQPEAGLVLATARERKAAERPLTLAIVSDDASVPQALQAGANSILRKPILVNQVRDTLTTARDLLRAKLESATAASQAAAAGVGGTAAVPRVSALQAIKMPAHAEEPPESSQAVPQAQIIPSSHAPEFVSHFEAIDSPKPPKPVATAVAEEKSEPESPPARDGARGLQWYLKTRAGGGSPAPAAAETPAAPAKPDLLGFDDVHAGSAPPPQPKPRVPVKRNVSKPRPTESSIQEQKKEADLFAYMAQGAEEAPRPKSRLGKGAIIGALALAACAVLAAPQAPWHSQVRSAWSRSHQAMRGWLNPQPVTPVQAPVAHEDFGRAGDEYKLPVAENIPDATTDPSQIQVLPVIDPTAKKTNTDAANPDQSAPPPAGVEVLPAPNVQVLEKQPSSRPSETAPSSSSNAPGTVSPMSADSPAIPPPISTSLPLLPTQPAPSKNRPPRQISSTTNVPSSLKSQLASMTPEASGNKAPEAAMGSIEPVIVPEAVERTLLTEQLSPAYPAGAKGQRGTVVVQVLIGRDGVVQDAKFVQGSLAFARAAIDGAKQWKFKPYTMNGRPVSVQTTLTISFRPQ
jgi:protein TonB